MSPLRVTYTTYESHILTLYFILPLSSPRMQNVPTPTSMTYSWSDPPPFIYPATDANAHLAPALATTLTIASLIPLPPPDSLGTLPVDILLMLRPELDQASRITLGRRSRRMYAVFEPDIWRNLNLFLDISDSSWQQPDPKEEYRRFNDSSVDLRRYVLSMMRMMDDVRSEGNRSRYGLIKSIKGAPFIRIADAFIQLLIDVSPNLEHLEIFYVGLSRLAQSFETRLLQKHSDSLCLFDRYVD